MESPPPVEIRQRWWAGPPATLAVPRTRRRSPNGVAGPGAAAFEGHGLSPTPRVACHKIRTRAPANSADTNDKTLFSRGSHCLTRRTGTLSPRPAGSEGLKPGPQKAELVALWVGQHMPALGASLADISGPGTEGEKPLEFSVLVAVRGVKVDVQSELAGPGVGAGAEDQGRLRTPETSTGRPDLDAPVVLPAEFYIAEDFTPEGSQPVGVGGSDDEFTDAAGHVGHDTRGWRVSYGLECRYAMREAG